MCNAAVALMRRPAVRRRLQGELAALPEQPISYEELLCYFIDVGASGALKMTAMGDTEGSEVDISAATQLAAGLLPQLAPDNPKLRYKAASLGRGFALTYPTTMAAALDVAQQQGSDFYFVLGAYDVAVEIEQWVDESSARSGVPPPSAVLGWLQQAESADRRCRALLPKLWTNAMEDFKAPTAPAKAILQHLQQQGGRWRRLPPAVGQEIKAAVKASIEIYKEPDSLFKMLLCSGCGLRAPQLRVCAACREAQYCR